MNSVQYAHDSGDGEEEVKNKCCIEITGTVKYSIGICHSGGFCAADDTGIK